MKNNEMKLPDNLDKQLLEKLNSLKKTAYLPKVKAVDASFDDKSKFGGFPYLRNENDWPVCPNCGKHQQLFLQLNLSTLPVNQAEGLIQLFYCTTDNGEFYCEDELMAYAPDSKISTCRKIQIEGQSAAITPMIEELFDEKIIENWGAVDDYPHPEEIFELDIKFSDEEIDILFKNNITATTGDKLFGYPYWVQGVEYPTDANGEFMEMVFQLDSEKNLPYMFGDLGVGHLTQSKNDDEKLSFGWACH